MQQYANEESFRVYIDYLALKKHFESDDYDYFKYNGKVRASFDKFLTRPDAIYFNKLAKRPESRNLMLSNIIQNPKAWIRDLCDEEAKDIYLAWKKNVDALTHVFTSDLSKLDETYKNNFVVPSDGQYPLLLNLYIQRKISLETFALLFSVSNVDEYWTNSISDKFIAKNILRLARKYRPFLEIENKKVSQLIKSTIF